MDKTNHQFSVAKHMACDHHRRMKQLRDVTRGIIIRSPFVDWILQGKKKWEIRGRNTNVRERIGLIRGGSGFIVGTCNLVDVVGPLSLRQYKGSARKAGIQPGDIRELPYPQSYAWVLEDVRRLKHPISYNHPTGAVIWVRLQIGH